MKLKHRLSVFLAVALWCTALSPSFAQAVEKPFENQPQSTDISPVTVGNIVGNGAISASSDKNAQTAPESHENPTEDTKFSTFSEKFSTEDISSAAAHPVEKSPLEFLYLTRIRTEAYTDILTDRAFSAVWSIDAENRTAELTAFTGKPELFEISLHSQGISIDYLGNFHEITGEDTLGDLLNECISYEFAGFTKDPAAVRDMLNTLVSAEAVTSDGVVHPLTFDYLGLGGGNGHYDHDYYFTESLYDDVVEFRFSLHLPEPEPVPMQGIDLTNAGSGSYEDIATDGTFSAVWTLDHAQRTAELTAFTGKPELFSISLNTDGFSIDYSDGFILTDFTFTNRLHDCISYEFGFPVVSRPFVTPDEVREELNRLVSAAVLLTDGTEKTLTIDALDYWQGNNHYRLSFLLTEPLYTNVKEFRLSLQMPDKYAAEPVETSAAVRLTLQ